MPDVKKKTIVKRLQSMGGVYDQEAKTWTIPTDRLDELRRLLADISANVQWKGGTA
jgi:hypothetical protein